MSIENVKIFFGRMENDEGLKNAYIDLVNSAGNATGEKLSEGLVRLGGSRGFAFSKTDLFAARSQFTDAVNANNELSETELGAVAGGANLPTGSKAKGVQVSLTTIGIGCLIWSATSELKVASGGACAAIMSTNGDSRCNE